MLKNTRLYTACLLLAALCCLAGCQLERYPQGKPYVYKTKINIAGNYSEDEKKALEKQLEKQLDDSLRASRERKKFLRFFGYNQRVYHEFETGSLTRTLNFFTHAYVANGYFRGGLTTWKLDTLNNDGRLALTFTARPNKNHRIDTVKYDIADTQLQQIALAERKGALVKKGDLYSQQMLNAERSRLTQLYRNRGYFKITRDDFRVEADTLNRALFVFTTDPFEQARLLDEATRFDANPTTAITFHLTSPIDSAKLKPYYVGKVFIYPDNADDEVEPPYSDTIRNNLIKRYFRNSFRNAVFGRQVYLKKGEIYRQDNYDKTYNTLNYLGPWQQVNIVQRETREDTVDFNIYMLPYRKYQGERKLEGSVSQQSSAGNTQSGNLWGIILSQTVKNRNLARSAIQSSFEARTGIEFRGNDPTAKNRQFINSGEFSLTYETLLPYFMPRRGKKLTERTTAPKSLLTLNTRYTQRFKLFELAEVNLAHAYQGQNPRGLNWTLSLLNFERKFLKRTDSLQNLIDNTPILAFIFNDGMILGQKLSLSKAYTGKKPGIRGSFRFSAENSGLPFSPANIKEFKLNLFSYIKLEYDRVWNIDRAKTGWAFHTFLGLGQPYMQKYEQNQHLPFFKQFSAGGPNSMRAWTVRSLNSYSTRTLSADQRDFFGDIKAEVNAEFRYKLFNLAGFPIRGAWFADMGNIWNLKPYEKTLVPAGMGTIEKIWNDVALAGGTSIRADFDYFLVRLDFGLKLKTPKDIYGKGGFLDPESLNFKKDGLRTIKMQVGINYPF